MYREGLELACQQIQFAREYTNLLLDDVADDEWFVSPHGVPTHLAWQMGHLAMAQYGLMIMRIRGRQPEDSTLIGNDFIRCFKKGTQPGSDASAYPRVAEIRAVFDKVHRESLRIAGEYTEAELAESVSAPYAVYPNKLGSILFCPAHEMLHAGQIGILRRMLGKQPLR